MNDDINVFTALRTMDGFKFAKEAGRPLTRQELVSAMIYGGIPLPDFESDASRAFDVLTRNAMILPCGDNRWVCNRDYRPTKDDWWYEDEEFGGPAERR